MHAYPIPFKNFTLGYIAWWIASIAVHTLILWSTTSLGLNLAIYDAVITNILLGLAGYLIINTMKFYQPRKAFRPMIWIVGLTAACILIMKGIVIHFFHEQTAYIAFLHQTIYARALFMWLMISLATTVGWVWFYMLEKQQVEQRKADTEKLSREAELSKLRQQLQPHFLFNSLNSISALAGSRPEEARKMIQQLSDFLRGTIKRDDQQLVSLEEELKHLQLYLEIEKVRFGHRLKTEVIQDNACLPMMLPSLLLQPVVENAIKFGLYDTTGEITIRITATTTDKMLVLTVENPFDPSTAAPQQGTGFGLSSVQRRLYLLYLRHDLLATRQNKNIFITQLSIPQNA